MAKIPNDRPCAEVEESRFVARASAIAFGGQVTALAKAPTRDPRTWLRRKRLKNPITLRGVSCVLPPNGGGAIAEGRGGRTPQLGPVLSRFAEAAAETHLEEVRNSYVTHVRAFARNVKIGAVDPVTFPLSEVLARWTYVDKETPPTLRLDVTFAGFKVRGQPLKPVPIRPKWPAMTFADVGKQIDSGRLMALPWSSYQKGEPADQLAVTLADRDDYCDHVPELGRLYFAELIMTKYDAQFSLVRLELGSPAAGTGVIAMAIPNGGRWP